MGRGRPLSLGKLAHGEAIARKPALVDERRGDEQLRDAASRITARSASVSAVARILRIVAFFGSSALLPMNVAGEYPILYRSTTGSTGRYTPGPMNLVTISRRLCRDVQELKFGQPITHVYNPLEYAREPHERYLERYGNDPKQVVLVGMNPGPFGMAQTGVPFGDVAHVRGWLGIEGHVGKPPTEHPGRPVEGFACPRAEVSGQRLWGWAAERFGTPVRFFERFFVVNYCPLVFIEPPAKNRTPDKLGAAERDPLFAACDHALRSMIELLRPTHVVGVGAFAAKRCETALTGNHVRITTICHPSPASPLANRGWAAIIEKQLAEAGVDL